MANSVSVPRPGTQWNVESGYTKLFVTAATYHDRPEIDPKIWDYPQVDLFTFMKEAGKMKLSGNVEFTHAERDARSHVHTVSSVADGAAPYATLGVIVTLTTGAGDHLQTGTLSQPKVRDQGIAYTGTGKFRFYVVKVDKDTNNAHEITLMPTDGTTDLFVDIDAGDKIVIFASGFGDGTSQPEPTSRIAETQTNNIQTFKSKKSSDGRQAATETYWQDPKSGRNLYVNSLLNDGEYEIRQQMDFTFLLGEKSSSLSDPTDTSKKVYFNGGLDWYANNQGYLQAYTAGAMDIDDIEAVIQNLTFEKAPTKQLILPGITANLEIDAFMKTYNDNTGINWAQMGIGNAANRMVDFGIDGFRHGNFTFMKKSLAALNEQGVTNGGTGATLMNYPATAYTVPWGSTTDGNGKSQDYVCIRFMQNTHEGSRYMQYYVRGKEQHGIDRIDYNWQAEAGLQIYGSRMINILAPA